MKKAKKVIVEGKHIGGTVRAFIVKIGDKIYHLPMSCTTILPEERILMPRWLAEKEGVKL